MDAVRKWKAAGVGKSLIRFWKKAGEVQTLFMKYPIKNIMKITRKILGYMWILQLRRFP